MSGWGGTVTCDECVCTFMCAYIGVCVCVCVCVC